MTDLGLQAPANAETPSTCDTRGRAVSAVAMSQVVRGFSYHRLAMLMRWVLEPSLRPTHPVAQSLKVPQCGEVRNHRLRQIMAERHQIAARGEFQDGVRSFTIDCHDVERHSALGPGELTGRCDRQLG